MNKRLTNLVILEECDNLIPATEADEKAINEALVNDIELTIDEMNRVFNEGGQYIADLVKS